MKSSRSSWMLVGALVIGGCTEPKGGLHGASGIEPEPRPRHAVNQAADARIAEPSPTPCCPAATDVPVPRPSLDYPGPTLRGRLQSILPSADGRFAACGYDIPSEEAVGALAVCEGTRRLHLELFLGPIAWENAGGRLLVGMVAPDDDPDLFVLDVKHGQVQKSAPQRAATRIGGRYDRFIRWNGDWICAENTMIDHPKTAHRWLPIPDRLPKGSAPPTAACP